MNAPTYLLWLMARLAIGAAFFFVALPFGMWLGRIVIIGNLDEVTE
jgi:hypothetical protein